MPAFAKPLGRKNYGSIGHLPHSRVGAGDWHVPQGQADIATLKTRDRFDVVIVQEKLDGSNVGVAKVDGRIIALGRAGYPAQSSKYEQHQLFAYWVRQNEKRFDKVLNEGERIVGEWLAQAHGTVYNLGSREPFAAFDLMLGEYRLPYAQFINRIGTTFDTPNLLHIGKALPLVDALQIHRIKNYGCADIEGVVYRVERKGEVDFLCKYVRPDKVDGKYLPEVEQAVVTEEIWNWRPAKEPKNG